MLFQRPGIFLLVVIGDIGGGHHNGGNTQGRQFADGGGPCPADHQVRRPHYRGHVVDVLPDLKGGMGFQRHTLFLQQLHHHGISALSRAVNVVERLLPCFQGQHIRHLGVHPGGPQGPPEGDDEGPPVIDAQLFLGCLLGQGKEVLPHRRAGDGHLVRVLVMLPAGFKPHHDPPGEGLQQLRGQPRHGIGLVDSRGDAQFGGSLHGGVAGVAAGTDDHVRPELPQNGLGLRRGADHIEQGHQVMPDLGRLEGPVKAGNVNGAEVVSRLGDQVLFQAPLRPHKQDFHVRVLLRQQLGHGDGRIHMARRAAAGKDHPVNALFHHTGSFRKEVLINRPKRRGASTPP